MAHLLLGDMQKFAWWALGPIVWPFVRCDIHIERCDIYTKRLFFLYLDPSTHPKNPNQLAIIAAWYDSPWFYLKAISYFLVEYIMTHQQLQKQHAIVFQKIVDR